MIAALGAVAAVTGPGGVTVRLSAHSIEGVTWTTAGTLTKRRAVDFCHVATAICPPAPQS